MIRVLVVEDSATAREALLAVLGTDPVIDVVGTASNGAEAVALTRHLRPDIVTLDIHMPVLDGYEATRRIMVEAPTPILIVSSSADVRDAETSLNALRAGALGLCEKPSLADGEAAAAERSRFLDLVRALSDVKVVRRTGGLASNATAPRATAPGGRAVAAVPSPERAGIVALAASTGGPAALARLVAALPPDLPVPLLAVQHNTRGFMPALAGWLNGAGDIHVRVAVQGEPLVAGHLILAPDDKHLGVDARRRVALADTAPIDGFRPSATHLFASVAHAYGPRALAVMLTGMGSDGVDGLRRVRAARGRILAQDETSAVVYGMPRAAVAAGVVDEVVPLGDLPARICAAAGWTP